MVFEQSFFYFYLELKYFFKNREHQIAIPSNSHKNAAVSGPPHRNACQRKSRTGSMTAHNGDSITGNGSAQNPDIVSNDFELL